MPKQQSRRKSHDVNCDIKSQWHSNKEEALSIINPIHLLGSKPSDFVQERVMVGVSILPKSPLLTSQGCWMLVSFLIKLPQPSLIFLVDSLNRHNVKAFPKKRRIPTDKEALEKAIKAGDPYHRLLSDAIKLLEKDRPEKKGWISLLRYEQVMEENQGNMKTLENIAFKHYLTNNIFKERIDKVALEFLKNRRPQSKNHQMRLVHIVNYLVSELPTAITGFKYQGVSYRALGYPIDASKDTHEYSMTNSIFCLVRDIHVNPEFKSLLDELVAVAGQEGVTGVTLLPIELH